jgi:hypothetical protein
MPQLRRLFPPPVASHPLHDARTKTPEDASASSGLVLASCTLPLQHRTPRPTRRAHPSLGLLPWVVEEKEIKVTSPAWVKDGRQWQASYGGNKETLFTMEDEGFWRLVEDNKLKPKIPDLLVVQWAVDTKSKGRKKVRVLRVLEYNRTTLAKPLTNRELNKILTAHSIAQDNEEQEDLFNRQTKTAR